VTLPLCIMNFSNLHTFDCSYNNLESLPENMNFPNLHTFYCTCNNLESLPENMNFPNLHTFLCSMNYLVILPENMNFPNLRTFNCSRNKLVILPENMNFPNLRSFNCNKNKLKSLPVCILNFRNITEIYCNDNPIELSPQIARFLNMIKNKPHAPAQLSVYNDTQNVHNTTIQLSVQNSINRLTCRSDLSKYDIDILRRIIVENDTLTEKSKQLLLEYIEDTTVHSLLLLTFSEVLWYTLQTIIKDFDTITQKQIYEIMNQEIMDAECKCFTGRMNRIINCLNGFSSLVKININESEQIGNIIVMVKNRLPIYTVEKHKEEVRKELLEREYEDSIIELWLPYIE
jgi:Leucine-rich repeat (LRR) protein